MYATISGLVGLKGEPFFSFASSLRLEATYFFEPLSYVVRDYAVGLVGKCSTHATQGVAYGSEDQRSCSNYRYGYAHRGNRIRWLGNPDLLHDVLRRRCCCRLNST